MVSRYRRYKSVVQLIFFGLILIIAVLHTAWGYMNLVNTEQHVNLYLYSARFMLDCFSNDNKIITSQKRSYWRNICQQHGRLLYLYHASTQRLLSRREINDDDFDFDYELYSEETDENSASEKRSKLPDPYNSSPMYSSLQQPQSSSVDGNGKYSSNYENIYFKTSNSNRNFLKKRNEYRQKSNLETIGNKNGKKNVNKYSWTRKTDRQ